MSDSNLVQVASGSESSWGTTAASLTAVPITGGSMTQGLESTRSNTIRSDAQLAASTRTNINPTASYDFEFAPTNYDGWLKGSTRSDADWSTAISTSGNLSSDQGTKTITAVTSISNATKGQWVYIAGFSNAATNGWNKVATVNSGNLVMAYAIGANESAGTGRSISGSSITNGSTSYSFTLQEQFTDLTTYFLNMVGARPNGFRLSMTPGGILTGSCSFDGKVLARAAATLQTVSAAADKDPVAEVDGFDGLYIDGTKYTGDVLEVSLNIATANRAKRGLGTASRSGITMGAVNVTGSLRFFRDDTSKAEEVKLLAYTSTALGFAFKFGSDRYFFDLPVVKYTSEPGNLPGLDQEAELAFEFAAEPGGSYGSGSLEKTISITKVVA